jgi:hypothetical protein
VADADAIVLGALVNVLGLKSMVMTFFFILYKGATVCAHLGSMQGFVLLLENEYLAASSVRCGEPESRTAVAAVRTPYIGAAVLADTPRKQCLLHHFSNNL